MCSGPVACADFRVELPEVPLFLGFGIGVLLVLLGLWLGQEVREGWLGLRLVRVWLLVEDVFLCCHFIG
jgi:hypothetical protein